MSSATELEIAEPPSDGITRVRFSPSSNHLIASSWDKRVRLYDVDQNLLLSQYEHQAGVLDCVYGASVATILSGGVDKRVRLFDVETSKSRKLGVHDAGVKCVEYSSTMGFAVSGGWDSTVRLWDPRLEEAGIAGYQVADKVFSMALVGDYNLVLGLNKRRLWLYDLRSMDKPLQERPSNLKYQTRAVAAFPDGKGFAVSSIEGRVSVEYVEDSKEAKENMFAFKCHRESKGNVTTVYSVNAMAFHPILGTFATGGGDGKVYTWDGNRRKRICSLGTYPTSVASLDFNVDGTLLAIASSYTFSRGDIDHPADAIYIHNVEEKEVMLKSKSKSKGK